MPQISVPTGLLTRAWAQTIATAHNTLDNAVTALQGSLTSLSNTVDSKYVLPSGGAGLDILSAAAKNGLVQTDGTVLRAVRLSQSQYDALGTKVSTTLYIIV